MKSPNDSDTMQIRSQAEQANNIKCIKVYLSQILKVMFLCMPVQLIFNWMGLPIRAYTQPSKMNIFNKSSPALMGRDYGN